MTDTDWATLADALELEAGELEEHGILWGDSYD
jgi:hypothetical protein